ncbi:hypothetical protein [Hydrogenimonas sp. SS33]|uniref:hypothetical protein n=1 Tax=Hydrogenimonas leucolamina TaxID=2954236 RepID=UPI00336C0274
MKRAALFLLAVLSLMGADLSIDVQAVASKFDRLGKTPLPPTLDFHVYDPFRRAKPLIKTARPAAPAPAERVPTVSAVMNGRAFIDGRWVAPGQHIGAYRLVAARSYGVIVERAGRKILLRLGGRKNLLKLKDMKP